MKFIVNKEEFEKAVIPVSIIAQNKSAESTFSGIYIEAAEHSLILYCYDVEKGIRTEIDATVERKGAVIADTQIVQIIHSMPSDDITVDVTDNFIMTLTCGDAVFQVVGKNAENYPKMPEVQGNMSFQISKKQLKNAIAKTVFSVCKDDTKPLFKGSLFTVKNNTLTVLAIDGFRVAVRSEKNICDNEDVDVSFILPGKAEQNLLRLIDDSDDKITVELSGKHVIMNIDSLYFIIRLLEGDFPNYERYIPEYVSQAVINRDKLINSLERVAIINEKLYSSAKLSFSQNDLKLYCETESGKVNDSMPITLEGKDIEVLFNQFFLLDALKACENENICFRIAEGGKGTVICATPEDEEANEDAYYLYLVMPIRSR